MAKPDSHKTLGIKTNASEKEIKTAYRNLAKKYHPDKNSSPQAAKKFREITAAYDELLEGPSPQPYKRDPSYYDKEGFQKAKQEARKNYKATNWAKAKAYEDAERKKQAAADKKFRESEWYDLFLLAKYLFKGLVLIFAITAVIGPILLGIFVELTAFFATIVFILMGIFLLSYIWERRKSWFKLGTFNIKTSDFVSFFKKPKSKTTRFKCFYCKNQIADGDPIRIKMIKVLEAKGQTLGAMNHMAKIKTTSKTIAMPRSIKAVLVHRIISAIRVCSLIAALIFLPVQSFLWRIPFGLLGGAILSGLLLMVTRTKSKTAFLITPALLIKSGVWVLAFSGISTFGPGFQIETNQFILLILFGLFLILDMVFDLVFGFFPFYKNLFVPIVRQGKKQTALYDDGFQNSMEYPFYSVFNPLFRWLF